MAFATAAEWVDRLAAAHHTGRLQAELIKLSRYPLIVVDEVGCIPFEAEAANLFFQLISNRYERASVIVTSNKPFGGWTKTFTDPRLCAAIVDRLTFGGNIIETGTESYRLASARAARAQDTTAG